MNRSLLSLPILIVTLIFCSQLALGQQSSSTTGDQAGEAAVREKAFELLESLAGQLGALQSAENRARIGSNIAWSLWPHDEKRARAVFRLVEDDISRGLQVEKGARNADHTFKVFFKLRGDTLERMAKYDPALALAFLRETAPFLHEYGRGRDGEVSRAITDNEHQLELRLAKQIGATNPEIAIKLARESLAGGLSTDLLPVLRKASKDKTQALALYKEIVNKLRDEDFETWWTFQFAQRLALGYTPPEADEATYRELLQIFLTKAFAGGCAKQNSGDDNRLVSFCSDVASLVPVMERFFPAEARRLQQWRPEPDDFRLALIQQYAEVNEVAEDGSIDELLALTSKYPNIDGDIRLRAMEMAERTGDWERAEKIASSYNGDTEVRQAMDERVRYYKSMDAAAAQEWTRALKNAHERPLPAQVNALLSLAHNIALRDRNTTLKALEELSVLIDMSPEDKDQTTQQIVLASIYCVAKSDRGFAIMEGLLPKLNGLIDAGAKLDGYDSRYLRDGEWNMTAEGGVGSILTILANSASYFARYDFDRAVTMAGQFERYEIRMMAQLKLAQGILAGPPNPIVNMRLSY